MNTSGNVTSDTTQLVIDLIREKPRTQVELKPLLNVSRQRVEQIISKLEKNKIINRIRVLGERGRFIYDIADGDQRERDPIFADSRVRLLSSMTENTLYLGSDLAKSLAMSTTQVNDIAKDFEEKQLITSFRAKRWIFYTITEKGLAHGQYNTDFPKTNGTNLVDVLKRPRVDFIINLYVLKQARTIELSSCLNEDLFVKMGTSAGLYIQRLRMMEIIEDVLNDSNYFIEYDDNAEPQRRSIKFSYYR